MHGTGVEGALRRRVRLWWAGSVFAGIGCEFVPTSLRTKMDGLPVVLRHVLRVTDVDRHATDGIDGGRVMIWF